MKAIGPRSSGFARSTDEPIRVLLRNVYVVGLFFVQAIFLAKASLNPYARRREPSWPHSLSTEQQ
jgi:hypothetical protein